MKAKDIQIGDRIKATPWGREVVEGVVTKIDRRSNSGGCVITLCLENYNEAFSLRGSSSVRKLKAIAKSTQT